MVELGGDFKSSGSTTDDMLQRTAQVQTREHALRESVQVKVRT